MISIRKNYSSAQIKRLKARLLTASIFSLIAVTGLGLCAFAAWIPKSFGAFVVIWMLFLVYGLCVKEVLLGATYSSVNYNDDSTKGGL